MTPRYPGDTQDALFMDDGIVHWYLSPDIGLNGFGGTTASEGNNTVNLRVHLAAGKTFTASQADVEVFVGNPSITMTPTTTVRIGSVQVPKTDFPTGGGAKETSLPWTVTVDPADPDRGDQPGHRCLIARVYPFGSGKPNDFQVPTDTHEAQLNISIVASGGDGPTTAGAGAGMTGTVKGEALGPAEDGLWTFMADTATPSEDRPERVTVRATWANELPLAELLQIAPVLKELGFQGFAKAPPETFALTFERKGGILEVRGPSEASLRALRTVWELPDSVRTLTRPPITGRQGPFHEVDLELEPKRSLRSAFRVDLRASARGEAQAFHLEQFGYKGERQGGLTLVFVQVA
jgi:hypothetical protein